MLCTLVNKCPCPTCKSYVSEFHFQIQISNSKYAYCQSLLSITTYRHITSYQTIPSLSLWYSILFTLPHAPGHIYLYIYIYTYVYKCIMYIFMVGFRTFHHSRSIPIHNTFHDDVIKWKHFPRYWPYVRGIHRSPVVPLTKVSGAELWCSLWYSPKQTVVQTIGNMAIWDAIVLVMTSLWCIFRGATVVLPVFWSRLIPIYNAI